MTPLIISLILVGQSMSLPQEASLYRREAGMRYYGIRNIFETSEGAKYVIEKTLDNNEYSVTYVASHLNAMYRRDPSKPQITIKKVRTKENDFACSTDSECSIPLMTEDQTTNPVRCEVLALRKLNRLIAEPVESKDQRKLYIPSSLLSGKNIFNFFKGLGDYDPIVTEKIYNAAKTSLKELHLKGISLNNAHTLNFFISDQGDGRFEVNWADFSRAKFERDANLDPENAICYKSFTKSYQNYHKDYNDLDSKYWEYVKNEKK